MDHVHTPSPNPRDIKVHSFLVICGNKAFPFRQHQVVHPKDLKAYIKKISIPHDQ